MKKISVILSLTLGILFTSQIAHSKGNDGQWLLNTCNPAIEYMNTNRDLEDGIFQASECVGYIISIGDFNVYSMTSPGARPDINLEYCPPRDSKYGQNIRIIVNYLINNPEKLHLPAVLLALSALHSAWPCKENKS